MINSKYYSRHDLHRERSAKRVGEAREFIKRANGGWYKLWF